MSEIHVQATRRQLLLLKQALRKAQLATDQKDLIVKAHVAALKRDIAKLRAELVGASIPKSKSGLKYAPRRVRPRHVEKRKGVSAA